MNLSTNKYKLPELHIGNKTARIQLFKVAWVLVSA